MPDTQPHRGRGTPWDHCLAAAILVVGVAGAIFVIAGRPTAAIFEWIVFGSDDSPIQGAAAEGYAQFVYGVLGATMIGWAVALWSIARGPIRRRERWAWTTIVWSMGAWFVVDSTLSVLSGFGENALLNVGFAVMFTVPLIGMRTEFATTAS